MSTYLQQEFDSGMNYLRDDWAQFSTWAGQELHSYVLDPLGDAHFGDALSASFANAGQLLHAAFDDGVSSFRAGMSVAVGEFDVLFSSTLTKAFSHLPSALGGGAVYSPSASSERSYDEYKQLYSQNNTPYPTNIFGPVVDASGALAKNLLGLGSTAATAQGSLDRFGLDLQGSLKGSQTAGILSGGTAGGTSSLGVGMGGYIRGNGSEVFGLNMDGSVDMTDAAMGRNAHLGAYQETDLTNSSLLGAAVSPTQASALLGISDSAKAMADILGKYLDLEYGGRTAQVQVVDQAPNSNRGIELTPAAHRAVGDMSGDASIGYKLSGSVNVGAAMNAGTMPYQPTGPGTIGGNYNADAQAIINAQSELQKYLGTVQVADDAENQYKATMGDLTLLFTHGVISQAFNYP